MVVKLARGLLRPLLVTCGGLSHVIEGLGRRQDAEANQSLLALADAVQSAVRVLTAAAAEHGKRHGLAIEVVEGELSKSHGTLDGTHSVAATVIGQLVELSNRLGKLSRAPDSEQAAALPNSDLDLLQGELCGIRQSLSVWLDQLGRDY